jgi:hypothetical protein
MTSSLPEAPFRDSRDVTVGIENEWQVCVKGKPDCIDLVQSILASHHYKNLRDRTASGDISGSRLKALDTWIHDNPDAIWENSWIRLPLGILSPRTRDLFEQDLRRNRSNPNSPRRGDAERFFLTLNEQTCIRIPVSYLLKLAMHQISSRDAFPAPLQAFAAKMAECFINDNTSPEISSFYPVPLSEESRAPGVPIAEEALRRHLLTQWLTAYANQYMGIEKLGQHVMVYAAPHPPMRQQALNTMIPDSFYRELFMSPCLSGWEDGEAKCHYMHLCHQTLARSQINAVHKMKEAGIIQNNLVILPSLSHTGLSNNGLHISIGSKILTHAVKSPDSPFGPPEEKHNGDLATKIIEHFLPLFVGTYSAAPLKLDFADFHPERVLGFLPHEICPTHLRMLWRRWKKKGRFKVLGKAITPFGPVWLDRAISCLLAFKGDFVPDFRLLDYPVAISSTAQCPALDGTIGNEDRLLQDVTEQGIFDRRMPLYRLWRLRDAKRMGFSGFEARFYSLMPDTYRDLPHAVTLQVLLTAYAYQAILAGEITHADIPDNTRTESDRRSIFFSIAAGLPTIYIRKDNPAPFMQALIAKTDRVRNSKRYPKYWRVECDAYRRMLLLHLRSHASESIRSLSAEATLDDLEKRIAPKSDASAFARLQRAIEDAIQPKVIPRCSARECNLAAEKYYRDTVRLHETGQALKILESDLAALQESTDPQIQDMIRKIFPHRSPHALFPALRRKLEQGCLTRHAWHQWISLLILVIRHHAQLAARTTGNTLPQMHIDIGMHI